MFPVLIGFCIFVCLYLFASALLVLLCDGFDEENLWLSLVDCGYLWLIIGFAVLSVVCS